MPGDRAARPCRFFAPELSIIVHNFTHQVLNQLLSHPAVLLAGSFRDGLCEAPITSSASVYRLCLSRPPARGIGEKIIDQFDHHTMKAGALLVYSLF